MAQTAEPTNVFSLHWILATSGRVFIFRQQEKEMAKAIGEELKGLASTAGLYLVHDPTGAAEAIMGTVNNKGPGVTA